MAFNQRGFDVQYFNPETQQGETNGLYAAVTENDIPGNSGLDIQSFFDAVPQFVTGLSRASREIAENSSQIAGDYRRARDEIQNGSGPGVYNSYTPSGSIMVQWDALNFWEKFAVVLAVAVVVKQFVIK